MTDLALPSRHQPTDRGALLRRLFWRIHFWAGLATAPIVLFAAATGLLYVFAPQVEAWRHAHLDRVPVGTALQPLDAQVAAARTAFPHQPVRYVVPGFAPGDTTQVYLQAVQAPGHEHHGAAAGHDHGLPDGSIAYVNPYTATVVGRLHEMQRFRTWARKLHSTALQGEGWRWLLELGASWMLVLFATGLVLWWPRPRAAGGRGWAALWPRKEPPGRPKVPCAPRGAGRAQPGPGVAQWRRGRAMWRDLHAVVGIALGLVLAVVLVTGLTWARHAGANFRLLQDALGQQSPRPPADLRSTPQAGEAAMTWQAAWERARPLAPEVSMMLTAPRDAAGTWRIENFDRTQPTRRFTLVLHAYSGEPLFRAGWDQFPAFAQATAVGIPFHRGEFGVWNQGVLALAALAAMFSVGSGLWMWWLRRPRPPRHALAGAPPVQAGHWRRAPAWLWPAALALAVALPVWGWSLLLFAALEAARLAWAARRPAPLSPL